MASVVCARGLNPTLWDTQAARGRQQNDRRACFGRPLLSPGAGGSSSRFGQPRRVQPRVRRGRRSVPLAASYGAEPSLLTLPVFPLPSVLHPAQQGLLTVYEPRYLAMFRAMLDAAPEGRGARFVHVLSPAAAPPAVMETATGGLPRIACVAEVQRIEERPDGTLAVAYGGTRRVQLLMVQQEQPYATVAAEWYDDGEAGELDPTVDVLEQEAVKLLKQIEQLSARVAPGSTLPEAVRQYAPPAVQRKTSYDALREAGHMAAGHIEMWRRHGSVYKTGRRAASAAPDPYDVVREALGKARRQELFSFAAANMLVMGVPERLALLHSQDTGARLNFILSALHPYMLELQARASLQRGLQER